MKGIGYARVSSQDQIDGTSLEVQKKQIEAYAILKGIELVEILSETGISGGKSIAHRPEGARLTASVEAGTIQAVVVVKLDRAFRNTVDCLQTVESWEKNGVWLHIIDLGGNAIDTGSPAGRFMLTVLAAAAEMERGMIRDRCDAGRRARKAEGRRIGEIPFGWNLDTDGRTLVIDRDEQEAVALAVSMNRDGDSLRSIARELTRRGIRSKKGGVWTHRQVSSLLRRAA